MFNSEICSRHLKRFDIFIDNSDLGSRSIPEEIRLVRKKTKRSAMSLVWGSFHSGQGPNVFS